MFFSILTVFISLLLSTKGSYDLLIEDVIIPNYSAEYLTEPDAYIDDNHKVVVNFSILKQFPTTTQGRVSVMAASMGEYVVDTGIDLTLDLCDLLSEPILMGPLFQSMGFDPNICPPDVGEYGTDGYVTPKDGLPDDFPPNTYRTTIEIFDGTTKLLILQIFSKIV